MSPREAWNDFLDSRFGVFLFVFVASALGGFAGGWIATLL